MTRLSSKDVGSSIIAGTCASVTKGTGCGPLSVVR